VVLATRLRDGGQAVIFADSTEASVHPALILAAQDALAADESRTVEAEGDAWFLHVMNPPLRLAVVGAVHIAQALVPLAAALGYATTVIDPRRAFATEERFPNVTVSQDWPDEAMKLFAPDTRSAIVTLTHDPKLDDPALDAALRSSAFYIGALGSRKTHAARLSRLRELGHGDNALARIRGPVGLDIGAETAPEIALAILAEIVAVRRRAQLATKAAA
jgi:xanthine dehydrogenase accessory factor